MMGKHSGVAVLAFAAVLYLHSIVQSEPAAPPADGASATSTFGWELAFTPTTMNLNGVFGSATVAAAVGDAGVALLFDGAAWNLVATPTTLPLFAVWAAGPDDVFAVGASGNIYRFGLGALDDAERMSSGTALTLRGVWGRSANDVFAVGDGGTIRHFDGVDWNLHQSGTLLRLRGVTGVPGGGVFAVGDGGMVLHYDGSEWDRMTTGTSNNLFAVRALGPDNVIAVGNGGEIIRFDGVEWTRMSTPTMANLRGVWGSSADRVYAVGTTGTILNFDGQQWHLGRLETWANLNGITNGFAVGTGGVIFQNKQLSPEVSNLRITEIDPYSDAAEVTNFGPAFVSGIHPLCHDGDCNAAIPQGTAFPSGGVLVFPVPRLDANATDLWLFRTVPLEDPDNVVHGVKYGTVSDAGYTDVAVEAGVWPGVNAFAPAPPINTTLAYDGFGFSPLDWYVDETPTMGGPNVTVPGTVERELYYPSGLQDFDSVPLGDDIIAIRGWTVVNTSGAPGVFTAKAVAGHAVTGGPFTESDRWIRLRDQDGRDVTNRANTPVIESEGEPIYAWGFDVNVLQPTVPAGRPPRLMVQHLALIGHDGYGFVDTWGVEFRAGGAWLVVTDAGGGRAETPLDAIRYPRDVGTWVTIRLQVDLVAGEVFVVIEGIREGVLPIDPHVSASPSDFRLSYDGDGPGNVGTTLLDDVSVDVFDVALLFTEVIAEATENGAMLTWGVNDTDPIQGFRVYRLMRGEWQERVVSGDLPLSADTRRFDDTGLIAGTYHYRVAAVRPDGSEIRSRDATLVHGSSDGGTQEGRILAYTISQARPNPFTSSTAFEYTMPLGGPVEIRVYDVRGALVTTLENAFRSEGIHTAHWDGRDHRGNLVSAGTYFVKFQTPKKAITKKVVLVR